jgi:DNA-binding protein HU-beta
MTKNELARELADEFELPRRQIIELVEALLDRITSVLKSGDKVQLTPFGQFKIRDRAARIARNPQTGAPVNVPAKRVLKFIAGRALKEAVGTAKPGRGGAKKSGAKKSGAKKSAAGAKKSSAAPARKAAAAPARKAAGAAKKSTGGSKKAASGGRKTGAAKKGRGR